MFFDATLSVGPNDLAVQEGAPSPASAISRTAAWRIALRFSGLLIRAMLQDQSRAFGFGNHAKYWKPCCPSALLH